MGNPVHDEIMTWHGSPYDFDAFMRDKLGTGEGAQMYGFGVPYLAEDKGIGEHYLKKNTQLRQGAGAPPPKLLLDGTHDLGTQIQAWSAHNRNYENSRYYADRLREELTKNPNAPSIQDPTALKRKLIDRQTAEDQIGKLAIKADQAMKRQTKHEEGMQDLHGVSPKSMASGEWEALVNLVHNVNAFGGTMPIRQAFNEIYENIEKYPDKKEAYEKIRPLVNRLSFSNPEGTEKAPGRLYRVGFKANDSTLLDWDETHGDHHPEARAKIDAAFRAAAPHEDVPSDSLYNDRPGHEVYRALANHLGSDEAASDALLAAGIHGIRYFDANSRTTGPLIQQDKISLWHKGKQVNDKYGNKHLQGIAEMIENAKSMGKRHTLDSLDQSYQDSIAHHDKQGDPYGVAKSLKAEHDYFKKNRDDLEIRDEAARSQKTYNYVVFDPQLAQIREKYNMQGEKLPVGGTGLRPVDHDPFEGTP